MTTTLRRETAPRHAPIERIVVGPTLFTAITDPASPPRPRAGIRYAFPETGAAALGTAVGPDEVRDVVMSGIRKRRPDAIWIRDIPWFTKSWGVRATGRLERLLSQMVAGTNVEFVSWLEGRGWLRNDDGASHRSCLPSHGMRRATRSTARSPRTVDG